MLEVDFKNGWRLIEALRYFFDKSAKRKCILQSYSKFFDQEYRQILKHVTVRWLSLQRAVEKVLKQYALLKSYFLSKDTSSSRSNFKFGGAKRF